MNPIFIIGTERSGTNLLRLILNAHSHIAVPHPPHIMKNFFVLEPLYGDLSRDANFKKLIRDVVIMVKLHPYPWEVKLDTEKIFRMVRERNLINICFAIYDQYLSSTRKERWGCKSTFMIYHIALIRHYYPSAKFIYMVRDGRDVAVSARHTIFNHYHIYDIAQLWRKEQQIGIHWLSKMSKDNLFLLKYEGLISNHQENIKSLCAFLNEPYEEKMLEFFKTPEAQKSSRLSAAWENTSKPILKNNRDKFKNALSKKEIDLFEAVAGQELDYFSYVLTNPFYISESTRARGIRAKWRYRIGGFWLMLNVQIRHLLTDKNVGLRIRKFLFLKIIRIWRVITR